jgi:hypothetical protein
MTHVRASNQGAAVTGAVGASFTLYEELRAHDQLGSRCREAIANACFRWSSVTTLAEHKKRGWNPTDPACDAALAAELKTIDDRHAALETRA